MKFLLTHTGIINKKNLVEVKNWNGFADLMIAEYNSEYNSGTESIHPFAETMECILENYISDNGLNKKEAKEVSWEQFTDQLADDVFHTNAPHVFNGNLKQVSSFPDSVYKYTNAIISKHCAAHFDNVIIEAPVESEIKTKTTSTKTKAKYPGCYLAPCKANQNRAIANYRKDMRTIKLGFYDTIELAIEAKKNYELSLTTS